MTTKEASITIEPWLSVSNAVEAVRFYKAAFNAVETYRLETPDGGLVVKLSVSGAGFWLSSSNDEEKAVPSLGGDTVRMILTVSDPEAFFNRALDAGATQVFPVGEEHGWKLGRLVDPLGLHWEIGHQLSQ